MERKRWVGPKDGDLRVINRATMRIYSSPLGASVAIGMPARDIEANCNRWTNMTPDGQNFDWYQQYISDNPTVTVVPPTVEFVKMEKPKQLPGYNSRGVLGVQERMWMKLIYKAVTARMNELGVDLLVLNGNDLLDLVIPVGKEFNPSFHTTSSGLSRHIMKHGLLYRNLFDVKISQTYSRAARKHIRVYSFKRVENSEEILKRGGYEPIAHSLGAISWDKAIPVLNISTGEIYSSLRKAAQMTGFSPQYISYCCLGDLDGLDAHDHIVQFRFIEYVETNDGRTMLEL